ncbi:hypothetical protein INS49_005051 [Diaporthe citri]|uniref:uncharacterized protein n=1 Tax=Diaporthe citri TaxID=83186 RepID=UPI001C81BE38|nr:uncharacterized protein INS49_005051 [Diaporthe citri]KAG6354080.1 hypothetical protein INS49_005051 [Diaporthe citri]
MNAQGQKIAIIGSGCRFPGGANTPSKLWDLLREPRHLAESIPPDRFSLAGFYHPNGQYHGHSNVKKACFLEGKGVHRRFDASFFGINRVEANVMDPQARLLMETVYEALEAAGQSIDDLRGSTTAVFAGQMVADYEQVMSRMWDAGANGYGRGEGIAAIVLKTLDAAEEDGDHIECVIAETAVNHDGKTRGITMPNATAQTQLIRDCYARAGLDLTKSSHRPQYFEAHGTGTPAGDPVEAEAIASAFFPPNNTCGDDGRKLFVGSIKTVVGHTEGTAGLAGILKASLAMQNSLIPPNMLFEELNPNVRPFYTNLRLVTAPEPWPDVAEGIPRRCSVNRSYMSTFSKFLQQNEASINIQDLSYTLSSRRTRLSVATAVAALTADDLRGKVEVLLHEDQANPNLSLKAANKAEAAKVLGIFTGQGAQWAKMGLELIQESPVARKIINNLDGRLSQLPTPPSWSLLEEIERDGPSSRINEAVISQTVCTAVQILQVKLLSAAGVHLSAVVGHSSGEIAAAYAAGLISSRDAICIAYYRGLYSQLARGSDGQSGSMMAVGTTAEDAQELCDVPEYTGRVHVAAMNAPESVTLSGDRDAIEDLKVVFDDEGKFTRILRVDVAYHSHHLKESSNYYLDSLLELDIQVRSNIRSPWFSSVHATVIEVENVEIGKALSFDHDETRVETILSVTDIQRHGTSKIEARFNYSAESKLSANQFDLLASGRVRVTLGSSTVDALSAGPPRSSSLIDVDADEFYGSMKELEYEYSGSFASLHGLRRRLGAVTGSVRNLEPSGLLIHPGILDAAFQSAFLVYCAPGDGELDRMQIPRRIRKISVNPDLCAREVAKGTPVPFSSLRSPDADFGAMLSDIHLYSTDLENSIIQVQGLECVPLSSATAQDDKEVFSTLHWDVASPNAEAVSPSLSITAKQRDVASLLERMAVFYMRVLERNPSADHPARLGGPYASWFRFASHCTTLAQGGQLPLWNSDWENDTNYQLEAAAQPHSDVIDVMILRAVGENIVRIATGEASAIDICMRNDMLSQFYMDGIGLAPYTKSLARIIKQIVHRYPHMDILEVGAGTGACTQAVLSEIGSAFSSYTFTDISTSFFDSARSWEIDHSNRMIFKALDICQAPSKQGFQDHAYDVVVASLVLHATPNLEETLRNARRLLKPGGYLVAFELLPARVSYLGVIFGAFPGWWLGADEGRVLTPAVGLGVWDRLLRKSGFSGCDTNTTVLDEYVTPGAIFVSQALDDRITFIPLQL